MIIKRFVQQVEKAPQGVAVKTIRDSITYGDLWCYARRAAATFPADIAGQRVGLLFQHGIDMIAAMVSAALTGAVYVPLDRTYPESRLVYMLKNSGARMILTNSANRSLAERLARQVDEPPALVCIDGLDNKEQEGDIPSIEFPPGSLAYILYTSGSTGLPKGVRQTRENLLYYVDNWIDRFSLKPGERMTFLTAFSHDGAQQDIWSGLLSGSTLYPFDIKQQAGNGLLSEWVLEEKITVWHSVPTLFRYFIDSLAPGKAYEDLRWVLLGGEPLRERDLELFDKHFPHAALANVYGQTESSVNSIWTHRPGDSARLGELGQPLSRTELLLVNDDGEVVEDIGSGEIVVACPHIAPGYWEADEATEDKFSEDPDLGRLYWTGDMGGLKGNGAIEILGRRDFQVKIRGFRVETGEIESCLLRHEEVAEALVLLSANGDGEPFLCAYIVPVSGEPEWDANRLRQFAGGYLPDYMVPAHFILLEHMPLTPNGKIDRQALPAPSKSEAEGPRTPIDTDTEQELAKIWAKELKLEPSHLYKEANFFELGGHSLKGINVIAGVHQAVKVKLELEDIFLYPRLQELAAFIDGSTRGGFESIPLAPPRSYYTASSQQRRLYFLQQMAPESTAYNLPDLLELDRQLDVDTIKRVFRQLTERHESLRTFFQLRDGNPVQVIAPEVEVPFEIYDFSALDVKDPVGNPRVSETIAQFVRPFRLDTAPLLRTALIRLSETRQLFLVDVHHIIADGMSLEIFGAEFHALYNGQSLPPIRLQYRDYSEWLTLDGQQGNLKEQEDFWLRQFSGDIPVLHLPTDFPRPAVRGFDGGKLRFSLDPQLSLRLRDLVAKLDVTLYMLFLSVVNVLLHKLSRQEDIVVGTPVAGRQHADLHGLIGMFVNTLPLRCFPVRTKRFSDLLLETKRNTVKAFGYQDYPFEDLVEKVAVQRDTSRNPIFDVMFGLHNQSTMAVDSDSFSNGLKNAVPAFQRHIAKFDLTFHAVEGSDALMFSVEYSTQLFKVETIKRFTRYMEVIAAAVAEHPERELRDIDILSVEERRLLLEDLNDTSAPYPEDKTIAQLFASQAARTPDNIAIETTDARLSYRDLQMRADRWARHLHSHGVGPGSIVPFVLERSMDMMAVIYGIIAAGAAYLPIVPATPPERISMMLADCGAPLLVVSKHHDDRFSFAGKRLFVEDFAELADKGEDGLCSNTAGPNDPLYVIYTSGSTGLPKGVLMENRPVVNRLWWMQRAYPLNEGDVLLQKTTVMFDVSVWELFWWHLAGARLALLEQGREKFPEAIVEAIKRSGVTTIHFVPSMLQAFLLFLEDSPAGIADCSSLKRVFTSGEALEVSHAEAFKRLLGETCDCRLTNLYGPTEAAVDVSCYDCPLDAIPSSIPIGVPIDNTSLLVVDDRELQPVGVQGELWISGHQLARGYLNRPELTAEKFVRHDAGNGNRRYYRSGDLACRKEDGNIHYLGRIDHQVKLRGFRIELGEIQHRLLVHPLVNEALVVLTGDNTGDPALIAYLVVREGGETAIPEIRDSLAGHLPDYMIPSFFIPMESFPLTASGKIDRRALPSPTASTAGEEKIPVSGPWEEKLVELWAEVLGMDAQTIGATDNFFRIGGHSLKATVLASYIHRDFDVRLPLPQIFKTPTVRGLANFIQSAAKQSFHQIHPAQLSDVYPLSSAQKRMYILQQLDGDGTVYHIPQAVPIPRALDPQQVRRSLECVIQRHESFRTSFFVLEGEPVQKVHDRVDVDFTYYDGPDNGDAVLSRFIRPFDLTSPPLLRMALVKQAPERFLLLADMHHIISDGVSMEILVRDFLDFYNGDEPQPLKLQYKDFAVWQNLESTRALLAEQKDFWQEQLSGELPVLDLPLDFVRPAVQDFSGDAVSFAVGQEATQALRKLAVEHDSTLFMAFSAVIYCWLHVLSRQEDIIIGTPVAGRSHADCAGIVGMFVNTLALRAKPTGDMTFADFLPQVRDRVLAALDNQDYPFEELVDQLDVGRDAGRNPLFDVMVSFHKGMEDQDGIEEHDGETPRFGNAVARFDLTVTAVAHTSHIDVTMEYADKLFRPETIRQFGRVLRQVTAALTCNPQQPLASLDIVAPEEKERILREFNETAKPFPEPCSIPALFERQVAACPDRVALVWEGDSHLTYEELDRNANGLAARLAALGAGEQTIVALVAERSEAMLSGIMGILKAGCAYLPIDPGYPEARIRFMLQDSAASLAVTVGSKPPPLEGITIVPHENGNRCEPVNGTKPSCKTRPDDPAYIIYTSGTTGTPKGTLTTHRNAIRVVKQTNYIDILPDDRLLQLSNFAFDGSIFDIFAALLNGAALLLLGKEDILSARTLSQTITRQQVTVFFVTTALFNTLVDLDLDSLRRVRHILFGGERVSVDHARRALSRLGAGTVIHVYGPTETTVFASYYPLRDIDERALTVPIGYPIANTTMYVLSTSRALLPVGVPGELYIGGPGLARGYLNRPELTAEKFVTAPFDNQQRLYASGDLGRFLEDGAVEFIGRIDQQLKIRGFRIEPAEIQQHLQGFADIRDAVVVPTRDHHGEILLAAYIVADRELDLDDLRRRLNHSLPDYMIPAAIVPLETIPLNANGKVDRSALPSPRTTAGSGIVAPRSRLEERLRDLWTTILGIDTHEIGIDSDFFASGGHSLRATVMAAKIQKQFGIKIPLTEIFRNPTIRGIADYLKQAAPAVEKGPQPVEKRDYYPLASEQKRMYLIQSMNPGATLYNMPYPIVLNQALDLDRVRTIFNRLVQRHDSLRTRFEIFNGEPVQIVQDAIELAVESLDLSSSENEAFSRFVRPFQLSEAPLLRVALGNRPDGKTILLVDMHHIVSDGTTIGVLLRDLDLLANDQPLPPLPVQYKDYACWQQEYLESPAGAAQEEYWLKEFSGELPVLELPLDSPRESRPSALGHSLAFDVPPDISSRLRDLAGQLNISVFMLSVGLVNLLLASLSGQEDIVTGTVTAGREYDQLLDVAGMFVNTLPLRNFPRLDQPCVDFLRETGDRTLKAFENQDVQFERLIERLGIENRDGRNPLFDVMISMQNIDAPPVESSGREMAVAPVDNRPQQAKFDLTFRVGEATDRLLFSCVYRCSLWEPSTIQRFCRYFINICAQVADNPGQTIGSIDILSDEERNWILRDLNDTSSELPPQANLWELFHQQVSSMADSVALVAPSMPPATYRLEHQVTYNCLLQRSEALSTTLRRQGIGPDRIVAVSARRTADMIVALLGVLGAGGAYLPIDANCPPQRLEFLLEDSGATIVVCDRATRVSLQGSERGRQLVEIDGIIGNAGLAQTASSAVEPHHLAYVIYTSGSTGQPKGVLVEHRNAVNTVQWFMNRYQLSPRQRILQLTRYTFDASVNQIFGALLSGARLCVADLERIDSLLHLKRDIQRQRVTLVNFVPRLLAELFDDDRRLGDVTTIISGGEAMTGDFKDRLLRAGYRVDNQYGPTETTIDALAEECGSGPVLLGRPIANTQCYVLDRAGRLCAPGVAGELCVAGAGLARGYLNNPQLTDRLFVDNPFGDGRMYRTGDVCRLTADGRFQFVGRTDRQVKIRGNRVELGEIEQILQAHEAVKEVAVLNRSQLDRSPALVAYVTPLDQPASETLENGLRQWLLERAPSYMIPDYFITIDQMPLTPNGKLDVKALPEPEMTPVDGFVAPATPAQQTLAAIWERVLKRKPVSVADNFFQIGGNSLNVLQLIGGIHDAFGVDWPLATIFQSPVLMDQAELLAGDADHSTVDEPGLLLSTHSQNYLFCFPPGIGYGMAYLQLAERLNDVALFAFDYIDEPDIMERYIATIEKRQPHGDVTLLGYSAGGKLAVRAAQLLEERGRRVSDIIMLDSYSFRPPLPSEEVEEMERVFMEDFKEGMNKLGLEFLYDQVIGTMNTYKEFHHRLRLDGAVNAVIHLIRAQKTIEGSEDWNIFSRHPQQDYSGYGAHREMLSDEFIEKNSAIIKEILDGRNAASTATFQLTDQMLAAHRVLSPTSARFLKFAHQRPEFLDADNFQHILSGDKFIGLNPWPVFVDNRKSLEMETATMAVFDLIRAIPIRLFNNDIPRMSAYYQLPEAMIAIQAEGIVHPLYDHLVARGDYVLSPQGLKCIEYNVAGSLGGLQIPHWEKLYLDNPMIDGFMKHAGVRLKRSQLLPLFFRNMLEGALEFNSDIGDRINVAIVLQDSVEDENVSLDDYLGEVYRRELENVAGIRDGKVFVCDLAKIDVQNEGLYCEGEKIDIVVELLGGTVPPEVLSLFKNHSLSLYNGPVTGLLSNKLNLALLSENLENPVFTSEERDTIAKYVPWSRSLVKGARTTYDGVAVDLEDFLIQEKDRLVIKPASRYGGAGVVIGKKTDPDEWREMLNRAFAEQRWLVQEYHGSVPMLFQTGERGVEIHDVVWGFFVFGSYYAGGFVRQLPQGNRSGVINVHQGATLSMMFEMDE